MVAMESALRFLRLMQVALAMCIILYVFIGEKFSPHGAVPNLNVFYGLSFVSISMIGVILVVRRTLVAGSTAELQKRPTDGIVLARWKSAYILIFALCEVLALLGFILRFLGFGLVHVWVFYAGGFVLMLCFSPRIPRG